MAKYNELFAPGDQLSMEERIAAMIFACTSAGKETAANLGRSILQAVLEKFRPDLFTEIGLRHPRDNWASDTLQFPRFIEEAQAAGAFTKRVIADMSDSMDLSKQDIQELLDRAADTWEIIKQHT